MSSLKRFAPYYGLLAPYKVVFVLAILCGLIYAVSSGLGFPWVVKEVFPVIFDNDAEMAGNVASAAGDRDRMLLQTILLLPLIILVRAVAGFLNVYLMAYCGVRVLEKVRGDVFSKLQDLHVGYFQHTNKGDLISRLMVDCNLVKHCVVEVSNSLIKEPFTFLAALGYLVWLSVQHQENLFLLFCLAAIPICVLPIRHIGKKLTRRAKQLQKQSGTVTEVASENFGAVREVRAFTLEDRERGKFAQAVSKYLRFQLGVVKYDKSLSPVIEIITGLAITIAIYAAARSEWDLKADQVTSLFLALHMCYQPIKKIGSINNQLKRGIASLDRIEEILHAPVLIEDKPDARMLPEPVQGRITFENVSFRYDEEGTVPVLRRLDGELEPGKAYALVGPSGAGKSTFINLVLRFYDPTEGRILIDGIDLRDLKQGNLRGHMGLVPQDPVLFNDTIRENIRLSRPDATEAEIVKAAAKANALGFIENEPQGFDTLVGDRGTRLSGGQKQRIAIARAFLRNPPILILDEASSALDSESESRVQAELQTLMEGKTVLMIAHRFATLKLADEILVFDQGELTARGDHDALMKLSPVYQNLYQKQEL